VVLDLAGESWRVAKDVCDVLKIEPYRDTVSHQDEDERASAKVDTLGGPQEKTTYSESGLYTLATRSKKT
jgi:prophage antirepressor-like protein